MTLTMMIDNYDVDLARNMFFTICKGKEAQSQEPSYAIYDIYVSIFQNDFPKWVITLEHPSQSSRPNNPPKRFRRIRHMERDIIFPIGFGPLFWWTWTSRTCSTKNYCNIPPKNQRLEDEISFWIVLVCIQMRTVSFRDGSSANRGFFVTPVWMSSMFRRAATTESVIYISWNPGWLIKILKY